MKKNLLLLLLCMFLEHTHINKQKPKKNNVPDLIKQKKNEIDTIIDLI